MAKREGIKNRIYRVGIELEGGWEKPPRTVKIIRDGSIEGNLGNFKVVNGNITEPLATRARILVDDDMPPPRSMPNFFVGEIPSPILDVKQYAAWITQHYPQHVNESCGLHTHASFKSRLNYMRLMTPEFTNFIIKGLVGWAHDEGLAKSHPIWNRIMKKDHPHCAHVYLGDNQVRIAGKDFQSRGKSYSRYTALNYRWAQLVDKGFETGTVECRLLPMMDTADQAVKAVKEVFLLTNKFLAKVKDREVRKAAVVAMSEPVETVYRARI